jgi:hypothetical protein
LPAALAPSSSLARAAADPLATFDLHLPGPVGARLAGTAAARLPDEYGTPEYLLHSLLVVPPVSDADNSRMLDAGAGHVPVGERMYACASCTGPCSLTPTPATP